jgi:beta-N-acetylhexosaminidase
VSELERLAAGCLLPSFPGPIVPDWVRRLLERGLGGVVLFAYNVESAQSVADLTAAVRADAPSLLVATDEEGGDVTRLEAARGSSYPGNLALGTVDDVELTRSVAAAIASDLARVGINLNLAPVADVNTNPRNPVIGVRSFGSDPELVARHVAAFVDGTQRRGVAACAKHFPGHGDTAEDSHRALPVAHGDLEAALVPFRAAVAAGVRAVMTGHLVVPSLVSEPATVSRRVVTELLREQLGFSGLVVTDALEMRALSGGVGVEEGAVQALAAGVDALCLGHDVHDDAVESVLAAVVAAVESGRLTLERVADAAARVRGTAERACAAKPTGADGASVGLDAARRALRIHGDVRVDEAPFVLELVPEANLAAGEPEHGLADAWPGAVGVRLRGASGDVRPLAAEQPSRPLVLVVRDAARHEWQQQVAHELIALRRPAVVVETGLPGWRPPPDVPLVETAGAGRANLGAAVGLLRGGLAPRP